MKSKNPGTVTKSFRLSEGEAAILKTEAERRGITQTDVVRSFIAALAPGLKTKPTVDTRLAALEERLEKMESDIFLLGERLNSRDEDTATLKESVGGLRNEIAELKEGVAAGGRRKRR